MSGDAKHAADAIVAMRAELQAAGLPVTVVQAGDAYDFRVVFAEGDRTAGAVIAVDGSGQVVTVAVPGFIEKGEAEAVAGHLARKLVALTR